jgi:sterol desaturase/sphingolipid hydroxylase (fatty acid hydroxylase superfamily)/ferredoxin
MNQRRVGRTLSSDRKDLLRGERVSQLGLTHRSIVSRSQATVALTPHPTLPAKESHPNAVFSTAMARRIFALTGWPLLIILPMFLNWGLVQYGLGLGAAFILTLALDSLLIFAVEQLMPRKSDWLESDGQLPNDLFFTVITNAIVNPFITFGFEILFVIIVAEGLRSNPELNLLFWPSKWPFMCQFLAALVILELTRYWGHRWSHTNRWLWQFHVLHHSPSRLSVVNLGRVHPGELLPLALGLLAALILQVPKELLYWQGTFAMYVAVLAHSNLELRTGVLDYIFNTPCLHRWHHSKNLDECMHNYCHSLCLTDILFGTFHHPHGTLPTTLGVPMKTPATILGQLKYPFRSRNKERVIVPDSTELSPVEARSKTLGVFRPSRKATRCVELKGYSTAIVPEGRSILKTFLGKGVRFPHSCQMGECGMCKTLLSKGKVCISKHASSALSENEANAGIFLACCSTPLENCVVEHGAALKRAIASSSNTPPMLDRVLPEQTGRSSGLTHHRAKIAIIGAGFAGLAAAEALARNGIDYEQFDQGDSLGGIWSRDAYQGVHLITPKDATAYSRFPMPAEYPDFPNGTAVHNYLKRFAEQHHLYSRLKCNTAVISVHPEEGGNRWKILFANGEEYSYDGVVAATGNHQIPHRPEVEGHFDGHQFHSHDYTHPDLFQGKRVLVVGAGNSAADLAVSSSRIAASTHISMREGRWILPKCLFGRPTSKLLMGWMPLWILRPFVRVLLAISVGDYRRYGLQKPSHELFERDPTISDQLLHLLRHGYITPQQGIRRLRGREVEFTNGHKATYDVICWATGFRVALPYLHPKVMQIHDNHPMAIAGMFSAEYPNFYLFGVGHFTRPIPRYGVGPMISAGANVLALSILAQRKLRTPLGKLLARIHAKSPRPFSVNPTRALLSARLIGWIIRLRSLRFHGINTPQFVPVAAKVKSEWSPST